MVVGGLDANGCHTERSTGTYHCHGASAGPGSGVGGSTTGSLYIAPASVPKSRSINQKLSVQEIRGAVNLVSIGDGDKIRVVAANGKKYTIRLACIDAPETAQGGSGAQATTYLKQLLAAGSLEIVPQTVDRYGRTVPEVFSSARNVNLAMVHGGQAYAYRDYLSG